MTTHCRLEFVHLNNGVRFFGDFPRKFVEQHLRNSFDLLGKESWQMKSLWRKRNFFFLKNQDRVVLQVKDFTQKRGNKSSQSQPRHAHTKMLSAEHMGQCGTVWLPLSLHISSVFTSLPVKTREDVQRMVRKSNCLKTLWFTALPACMHISRGLGDQ